MKSVARDLERELPSRPEAERMILGVTILNNAVIDQAIEGLGQGDADAAAAKFFNWSNRQIFRAMAKMHAEGKAIDPLTLQATLQQAFALEKVGGPGYIASLFDGVPRFSNIESYVEMVKEAAVLREQITLGNWLMNSAWADDAESEEITRLLNQKLDSLLNSQIKHELISGATAADRTLQRLEDKWANPAETLGLKTGYDKLDQVIYGLRSGFYILAAPPKVGKTTLALNLVHNAISANQTSAGAPVVLFISLEMSVDQLTERAMAAFAKVSLKAMLTGSLNDTEKQRVREAREQIAQMPIEYLEGFESVTPGTMKAMVRKVKRMHGRLDLMVVDYIQLCDADNQTDNDTARVSRVSRELKRISKGFDIPVLGLSQVNRAFANRPDGARLRLTDLRQSGSLEQDADVVMFIQREDQTNLADNRRILEIAAQRGGESDVDIKMLFFGERSRFELADEATWNAVAPANDHALNGNGNGHSNGNGGWKSKKSKRAGKAPSNGQEQHSLDELPEDAWKAPWDNNEPFE
jgi:replicative DNA helicase